MTQTPEQVAQRINQLYSNIQSHMTIVNYDTLQLKDLAMAILSAKAEETKEEKKPDAA